MDIWEIILYQQEKQEQVKVLLFREDGKVDTETITSSFVGYSPSENPKMSIVVVSPDVSVPNTRSSPLLQKNIC